eukprot:7383731-Prymnesium_polylepis.1
MATARRGGRRPQPAASSHKKSARAARPSAPESTHAIAHARPCACPPPLAPAPPVARDAPRAAAPFAPPQLRAADRDRDRQRARAALLVSRVRAMDGAQPPSDAVEAGGQAARRHRGRLSHGHGLSATRAWSAPVVAR